MEKRLVYADNAATTPVAPEVLEKMLPWLTKGYGNPSTLYSLGRESAQAMKTAREQVAAVLGALPEEIFFYRQRDRSRQYGSERADAFSAGKGKVRPNHHDGGAPCYFADRRSVGEGRL